MDCLATVVDNSLKQPIHYAQLFLHHAATNKLYVLASSIIGPYKTSEDELTIESYEDS